jgi:hypothetical protein
MISMTSGSKNNLDPIYSYHTFMFPFQWKNDISHNLENYGWHSKTFNVAKSAEHYNEYYYFHDFARRTLFNEENDPEIHPTNYFEKNQYDTKLFSFEIQRYNHEPVIYSLIIDGVSLRTFETGVAILSINLQNINHRTFDDALIINDFGRRLYPQYLTQGKDYSYETKNNFLPQKIQFADIEDVFQVDKVDKYTLPHYITSLIGTKEVSPLLDDRMFIISHIMDCAVSQKLCNDYKTNELWYKYVYADSHSLNCQNLDMRIRLIEQSTYDRWSDYGTLYAITRYSFVCLSDDGEFSKNVLNQHIRRHYFQMMSLVLAVRASIIRFSYKVTQISSVSNEKKLSADVSDFYKEYIQFVNRIYFREISPQEQGIELYTKALEIMQIEKNIKDLDEEIAELFHYAQIKQQSQLNKHMATISEKGIPLMFAGLIAGIFGMNTVNFETNTVYPIWGIASLLAVILIALVPFLIAKGKQ